MHHSDPSPAEDELLHTAPTGDDSVVEPEVELVRKRRKVRKKKRRIGNKDGEVKFEVDTSDTSPVARRIILSLLALMILGCLSGGVYMLVKKQTESSPRPESAAQQQAREQAEERARISESLKEEPMDFQKAMDYEGGSLSGLTEGLLIIEDDAPAEAPSEEPAPSPDSPQD